MSYRPTPVLTLFPRSAADVANVFVGVSSIAARDAIQPHVQYHAALPEPANEAVHWPFLLNAILCAGKTAPMESTLRITLHTPSGRPIPCEDLGLDFMQANGLEGHPNEPFNVTVNAQTSKAGNAYYAWDLNGIPLPDGLITQIQVNGVALTEGLVGESKKGNPMRKDTGNIHVSDIPYLVSSHIVKTRKGYWVKVVAHKTSGRRMPAQ